MKSILFCENRIYLFIYLLRKKKDDPILFFFPYNSFGENMPPYALQI